MEALHWNWSGEHVLSAAGIDGWIHVHKTETNQSNYLIIITDKINYRGKKSLT